MKKEIVSVDEKRGIYQITMADERWYSISTSNKTTGVPEYKHIPSVTWITNYVYKGVAYWRWLAEKKNWDEAEAIKNEAGSKGSRIHTALEMLISGASVKMEDKLFSKLTEQEEELTAEEYGAILSFKNWYDETKPKFLLRETTVISEKHNFAGTVDCVAKIGDTVYVIDFKTSQYVWPSMEAQISAYKQALGEMGRNVKDVKLAILQIGYRRNKKNYKFTEVEDQFESLFLPAQKFWEKDNLGKSPKQIELPLEIKLNLALEAPASPKVAAGVENTPKVAVAGQKSGKKTLPKKPTR
jgi:genome maintenance exonuclease 1